MSGGVRFGSRPLFNTESGLRGIWATKTIWQMTKATRLKIQNLGRRNFILEPIVLYSCVVVD